MKGLIFVSVLWAFSFSFIGVYLAGQVDTYLAILIRFALALLTLAPFTRFKAIPRPLTLKIMGIGAIQIGLMYLGYYNAFRFLSVPEVILLTVFTPIYVTVIYDLLERRLRLDFLLSAIVAVIGALVLRWSALDIEYITGVALIQGANLCFALGQVLYKRLIESEDYEALGLKGIDSFFFFYLGALLVITPIALLFGDLSKVPTTGMQYFVLIWLGVMASGVGYLVWNTSSKAVSSGTLAVMNNLVIPIGILVNLVLWGRDVNLVRLSLGAAIILAALFINRAFERRRAEA